MRIDDLRTTLAEHADLTHDEGLSDRAGAVRGRVRTVRRRRAAVAAACVAGAVLAVPALQALEVTPPEPADSRDLAGRTAPETLVSNGFTYEFERGIEGTADEPLDLRLDRSDEPRLVSWTVNTGGEGVDGRLVDRRYGDTYDRAWTAGGTGFETFEYVQADAPAEFRLTPATAGATGEMAMAVYTLTDAAPEGVSGQGVTFRDVVDGAELLGAAIGEPGQARVSVDIEPPEGLLRLSDFCTASPRDYMVHVRIEGQRGYSSSSCSGDVGADAARGGWFGVEVDGSGSDTVRVTAEIHPDQRGRSEPVVVPGAVLGLGAYDDAPGRSIGVTETTLDELIETEGHTWALDELDVSTPGSERHVVRIGPFEERTYVETGAANDPGPASASGFGRQVQWSTRIDGTWVGRSSQGPSGSSSPGLEIRLDRGESMTIDLRAISGVDEFLSFYVATYALAD